MTNKEAIIIKLLEFKQGDIDLNEVITAIDEYFLAINNDKQIVGDSSGMEDKPVVIWGEPLR